jgi:hypothetical protein
MPVVGGGKYGDGGEFIGPGVGQTTLSARSWRAADIFVRPDRLESLSPQKARK